MEIPFYNSPFAVAKLDTSSHMLDTWRYNNCDKCNLLKITLSK
jgi:hypothetical protein